MIKTYPDVSQFWTYNPDEFLKHPVYNRESLAGRQEYRAVMRARSARGRGPASLTSHRNSDNNAIEREKHHDRQSPYRHQGRTRRGRGTQVLKVPAAVAQAGPIQVGFLTVKTGPLASGGIQMEQGLTVFFKERNNMLAGRKVELHTADTAGNPAQARTKTQELVERLNVSVLIGPLAAFEALAIDDYIRSSQTPILTVAGAEDMTQRKANPWLVRPSCTSAQPSHPVGDYAAKDLKLQARRRRSPTTSPSATRTSPASSACSRTPAARWCRSCARRSTRRITAPISRS